jgi:hypothetical protein
MIKHPQDRYQRRLISEKKKQERAFKKGRKPKIPETEDAAPNRDFNIEGQP